MAAKKRAKSPIQIKPVKPIVLTGLEKSTTIDIKKMDHNWSTFTLGDGTELTIKPVVIEVKRLNSKFNANGDPIYTVQAGIAVNTKVPLRLKKKSK